MKTLLLTGVLLLLLQNVAAQSQLAPDWKLKDITGRSIRLRDYKGKVVLLNFWATWCSPCRAEIPELIKWQRQYAKAGLQIIGITYPPQTRSEIRQFARQHRINYPIIQGTNELKSYLTASDTLPWTVVLDAAGNVHSSIEGILYEDEFAEKIKPLLRRKTVHRGRAKYRPPPYR